MTRREINQLGVITSIKFAALSLMAGSLAARLWFPLFWVGLVGVGFFLMGAVLWHYYDPEETTEHGQ